MVKHFGHWITVECRSSSSSSSSKNEVPSVLYNVHNQNIAEIDSICWLSTETMGKKLSRSDLDYKPI